MHLKRNHTSDKFLEQDIQQTLARYPALKRRGSAQGQIVLEGLFPLNGPDGQRLDEIELRIIYPRNFPFAYPVVCETAGRFSRQHGQMHLNDDGTLCLNSPQHERIDCYTGMDTLRFIEQVLIPNLAWRICVLEGIPFDRREFSHYIDGVFESYQDLLNLREPKSVCHFIQSYLASALPGRNAPCFCGSTRKYKACHGLLESNLARIGGDMLRGHLPLIRSLIK